MRTSEQTIRELERLNAKRTQGIDDGKWIEGHGCCGHYLACQMHQDERGGPFPISDYDGTEPIWLGGEVAEKDRKFIAAAVNALPNLLADIRDLAAMEGRVTELEAELARRDEAAKRLVGP